MKMLENPCFERACDLLLSQVSAVGMEQVPLSECGGRVLAQDLIAQENVPAFDRSPYDGYAVRAEDTVLASKEHPVTLQILEEIPAGAVPTKEVLAGTAAKVLTGAPIPKVADAVIMYEKTVFTDETVTLFAPVKSGSNIVRTGEDISKGAVLARSGTVVDPGLAGTLAAQGEAMPLVYRKPKVALLSTGSELVEADAAPGAGKIRNSNRYMLEAALKQIGCEPVYLGIAGDSVADISARLNEGLSECDAVVTTGGVSVGDYDLTPAAMGASGVEMLFRGVDMKPGMACAYGVKAGKLICGLSGNPASSLTNFYAVALPALRKLTGQNEYLPQEIKVTLSNGFTKKSPKTRFLRGRLELEDGVVCMKLPKDQGNIVLSSTIGCNVMAVVPAGSGPLEAGTVLKGFLL
ncbi:MAG: molybdopterin molybdotransferase MoeA [Ruminococcaceae bacterium]|nr:molybdopterin molybdotransferase MoeA [Oscillospiraceae bacterium]